MEVCYSCNGCGKCGSDRLRPQVAMSDLPGFCPACKTLNGPTSTVCKKCGQPLPVTYKEAKLDN